MARGVGGRREPRRRKKKKKKKQGVKERECEKPPDIERSGCVCTR